MCIIACVCVRSARQRWSRCDAAAAAAATTVAPVAQQECFQIWSATRTHARTHLRAQHANPGLKPRCRRPKRAHTPARAWRWFNNIFWFDLWFVAVMRGVFFMSSTSDSASWCVWSYARPWRRRCDRSHTHTHAHTDIRHPRVLKKIPIQTTVVNVNRPTNLNRNPIWIIFIPSHGTSETALIDGIYKLFFLLTSGLDWQVSLEL